MASRLADEGPDIQSLPKDHVRLPERSDMNPRILACAALLGVLACSSPPRVLNVSVPRPTTINGVEVEVTGVLSDEDGTPRGFAGTAINHTGEPLLTCSIMLHLIDPNGARLTTMRVSRQEFGAGRAWTFEAVPTEGIPADTHRVQVGSVMAVTQSGRALTTLDRHVKLPPVSMIRNLEVEVSDCLPGGPGVFYVRGSARNEGGADLATCELSFDLFNKRGERYGITQIQKQGGLADGETWEFEAVAHVESDDRVGEVRLGTVVAR